VAQAAPQLEHYEPAAVQVVPEVQSMLTPCQEPVAAAPEDIQVMEAPPEL
jgi:hypothetical protein